MGTLIAVTGGIGSGKSVVSRMLRLWNFGVFDCDFEAKKILADPSVTLSHAVNEALGEDVFDGGFYNRRKVSEIIFSDDARRKALNSVVHAAVREELVGWNKVSDRNRFVECAIAAESGILEMVEKVIFVDCPPEMRINRVCRRDGLSKEKVRCIMEAQKCEENLILTCGKPILVIRNDGSPILPQLTSVEF